MNYPEDPLENLIYRNDLLTRAETDESFRRGIIDKCKDDFLFWVGSFVWQYNPLKADGLQAGPFIPWDCQKRAVMKVPGERWPDEQLADIDDAGLLWCIDNGKSVLIEKSRDMGISWLCLLIFDWRFLFRPYQKFLCISRNEAAVEDEDPDSLFWKLDWVHSHLPKWLCPDIRRRKKFFGNDSLGSTITGQASTGLAGVGGRATAMLIDEFSTIKEDREVRQRTASTTNCRIFNGTHQGMDTEFYALSIQPEMLKLNVHWTQHPDKIKGMYRSGPRIAVVDKSYKFPKDFNFVMDGKPLGGPWPGLRSPWYDAKCQEIGSSYSVARELDINPSGSVSQFFEPLVISELVRHFGTEPVWEGDLEYDKQSGKTATLYRNAGGRCKLWVQPDAQGKLQAGRYGAGADVSMGTGASNSCLAIGNADTGEKVLEYQNPAMSPDEFSLFCFACLHLFKDESGTPPLLAWEHKGPGALFTKRMKELGYRHFFYRNPDELTIGGSSKPSCEPGWDPKSGNKLHLMNEYRRCLRKRTFLNRSASALEECLAWKYNKDGYPTYGKATASDDPSGARDNHGDQTIADALCCMMMNQLGVSEQKKMAAEVPVGSIMWRRQIHEAHANRQRGWVS